MKRMKRSPRTLPRSLDHVKGLRAALWVRESTEGQHDNFGPDAQRDKYAWALDRWCLTDSMIEWSVAASGWKDAWLTDAWADMVARAGVDFDVLVVGYASRFMRNLKQTLIAVDDHLHRVGVPVLFADERILSSDPDQWDQFARESLESESFSRKQSKRVGEGYASKRRRLGVPGGNRAPYGTTRDGRQMSVDVEAIAVVRHAYDLAGAGMTDRQVAAATRLRLKHVAEVLTNPFYVGRLRGGESSALGPLVDPALWDKVQVLRARFGRRSPGYPASRHPYALAKLLFCGSCGTRLIGDTRRYRHVDACEAFVEARPRFKRAYSNASDRRTKGQSYPADVYDGAIPQVLAAVSVAAGTKVDVVAEIDRERVVDADAFTLARIERDREAATGRYLRDRDTHALEATMARLDAEAEQARARPSKSVTEADARAYLEALPMLWQNTDDEGRRFMAAALFERIDVLGLSMIATPTLDAEARGLVSTLDAPVRCSTAGYGRGERI